MLKKELEQALIRLAEIEPSGTIAGLIYNDSPVEPTVCLHCGQPTGYGYGPEPGRYDTVVCSSACAGELYPDY